RRTPTSRSSLVSCWDKAGGVKERRSAAAVIEPAWAISTSTRNRWASSTYLSPLVRRTHLGPKLCLRIFSRHNFMLTAGTGRVESMSPKRSEERRVGRARGAASGGDDERDRAITRDTCRA